MKSIDKLNAGGVLFMMMVPLKSLLLIVLCRTTGAASSTIYWVHGLNMSVGIDSDDGTLTKINVGFTLASFFSVSPCTSA